MKHDSVLWSRVLDGDGPALGEIFDRHHSRVYRCALTLLRDEHEAQDATATAFLELWRKRSKVTPVDGSVLPWLLATTSNVCRNSARGTRRYRRLLNSLPRTPHENSAEQTAMDNVHVLESVDPELATALRRLPASTYALLILTAVEGHSTAEAAQAIGLSEGAARTRLSRARASIQDSQRLTTQAITSPEDSP